ncbi:hypothetical protein [Jannaschia sp. M317]|uniref:hypothetical protein n=1 Tax=Jannaschia sp. M317 TaxID=2867011 RepID=UPI0021A7AAE4|nr:hypothetical protein [Jannaschia sp. M317]UWQ18035.1 hypothetical protein K3551_01635 [Jannaschia sp. M317]
MTPTRRAIAFWLIRVAIAVILVLVLQAWQGPDPILWYLAAGYAVLSAVTTAILIRRNG